MPDALTTCLQHLVNGLSTSSIYVLLGVGITLIFGLSGLINFAHGQFLILGSFIAYGITGSSSSFVVAVAVAALAVGAVSVVSDIVIFQRTTGRSMNGFVASLGLAIALQALFAELWSADTFQVFQPMTGVWDLAGVRVAQDRVLVLVVTAAVVATFFWVLDHTTTGRCLKAAAEDADAAALMGVDVRRSVATAFFLGGALAGIAGALLGTVFPFTAFSGGTLIIKAFAVALVGGLGNVRGAAVAGLILGLAETLGSAYDIPLGFVTIGTGWSTAYLYILMVAILGWRPEGLFTRTARIA